MDLQHKRDIQIARTGGAGLDLLDTHSELTVRAELDEEDTDARNVLSKVKKGILRGLSVAFREDKYRVEYNGKNRMIIHEKAELRGVGVVDRPAYPASKLREQVRSLFDMDAEETRKLVEELLAKRAEPEVKPLTLDTSAITEELKRFTESVPGIVDTAVDAALQKRALAEETAAAVAEADATTKAAAEAQAAAAQATPEDADARAEMIMTVKALLPKDFETRGKTSHDILVAAAGDEITGAEERSDDYLMAKLEGIAERRDNASRSNVTNQSNGNGTNSTAPINLTRMVEQKRMAAAK